MLSQLSTDDDLHPVAYFSKKVLPREERYSTIEKVCLAVKLGIKAFRFYLMGCTFTVQTDHRALLWLDRLKDTNLRLTRWSLILQQYQFTVTHRPGSTNGNADALSRFCHDRRRGERCDRQEGLTSLVIMNTSRCDQFVDISPST